MASDTISVELAAHPLRGELIVPGDKSVSHRVAILGGLASGVTRVRNFLCSADCLNTLRAMQQWGAVVSSSAPAANFSITGVGMWFIANTFRVLAQAKPELKNGLYTYASRGFGKLVGFFVASKLLKLRLLNNLGSITGGMTSTPALGTLISVAGTDDVASAYAATYPIALVSVVLCSQFIVILFG